MKQILTTILAALSVGAAPAQSAVTGAAAGKSTPPRSVDDYGAVGDGLADDSRAVMKALAATGRAYLPAGRVYRVQSIILGARQRIDGQGALKGVPGSTMVTVKGDGARVSGIGVDAQGATYAIVLNGRRAQIDHVSFSGDVGHYVLAAGADAPEIADNSFDGTNASSIVSPVVIDHSTNYKVTGNRFVDTQGFAVQVRNDSHAGRIASNVFRQPMTTAQVSATGGQAVFSFALKRPVVRYGVQVDGVPTVAGVHIVTADRQHFTVTFAAGRKVGAGVRLVGFRALENININSRVYDTQIVDNDMDGTGDSGIVIGADYHRGALDPNHVDAADLPARITVRANRVRNAAYAGIAQTHAAPDCTIEGNTVQDNSQFADDYAYSAGILASGPNAVVRDNRIINTKTPATMRFGIVNNLFPASDGSAVASQRYRGNRFSGRFVNKYLITNQTPGQRRQSVMIEDGAALDYPGRIDLDNAYAGKPADTAYFRYANAGAGWRYDTADRLRGAASLGTIAGAYVDVRLPAIAMFRGHILKIDFMAKAASGVSYFMVFSTLAGGTMPVRVDIAEQVWRPYTLFMPLNDLDVASVFLRIGADSGKANIRDIRITGVREP